MTTHALHLLTFVQGLVIHFILAVKVILILIVYNICRLGNNYGQVREQYSRSCQNSYDSIDD
jgi:hypothetical protein